MPARFFGGPGSVWSSDVTAAPVDPLSSATVAALQEMMTWNPNQSWYIQRWNNGVPINEVDNTIPRIPVYLNEPEGNFYAPDINGNAWNKLAAVFRNPGVAIDEATHRVSFPADWISIIHNTDTNELWEFWHMWKDTTGGAITSEMYHTQPGHTEQPPYPYDPGNQMGGPYDVWIPRWGGYIRDVTTHPGQYNTHIGNDQAHSEDFLWGVPATSLSMAGGLILEEELIAGEIPHALNVMLPWGDGYVWPAWRSDNWNSPPISEGMRWRLKASFDPEAITFPTTQGTRTAKIIARAAKKYGIINNDHSSGIVVRFEWPRSETDYYDLGGRPGFQNEDAPAILNAALPLDQLELVDYTWRPPGYPPAWDYGGGGPPPPSGNPWRVGSL